MAQVLIVGYGNPLRGDDGLGWHAVQLLAAVLRDEDVHILACHQLTPELAEPLSRADLAVFIDATQNGPPGLLSWCRVVPEPSAPGAFSHHLTPFTLLACVQMLYDTCPETLMVSVTGAFFGYSEQLSPAVQATLPRLVERVRGWITG
jgi:hydrogenase maturation protease